MLAAARCPVGGASTAAIATFRCRSTRRRSRRHAVRSATVNGRAASSAMSWGPAVLGRDATVEGERLHRCFLSSDRAERRIRSSAEAADGVNTGGPAGTTTSTADDAWFSRSFGSGWTCSAMATHGHRLRACPTNPGRDLRTGRARGACCVVIGNKQQRRPIIRCWPVHARSRRRVRRTATPRSGRAPRGSRRSSATG